MNTPFPSGMKWWPGGCKWSILLSSLWRAVKFLHPGVMLIYFSFSGEDYDPCLGQCTADCWRGKLWFPIIYCSTERHNNSWTTPRYARFCHLLSKPPDSLTFHLFLMLIILIMRLSDNYESSTYYLMETSLICCVVCDAYLSALVLNQKSLFCTISGFFPFNLLCWKLMERQVSLSD